MQVPMGLGLVGMELASAPFYSRTCQGVARGGSGKGLACTSLVYSEAC